MELQYTTTLPEADLPTHALDGDVGIDIRCLKVYKQISKNTVMYDTGICVSPPAGYYIEIVPRSSLSKFGYVMPNSFGVIDVHYRGSLKIVLTKIDESLPNLVTPFSVCQLILRQAIFLKPVQVNSLDETERGDRGFGSTGN
jgi:dUTP pyrophosphatase